MSLVDQDWAVILEMMQVPTPTLPTSWMLSMASLLILAGTFWSVFNYPIGALILLIAVLVYGAVVFFYPVAWLVVLPLMLPLIDLAPWTGRFFLDEFDIFVAMTLAVSWWKDRHLPYRGRIHPNGKVAARIVRSLHRH